MDVKQQHWAAQYPAAFLNAVAETLEREGGFVNDVHDPGGATNWGISLRFLRKAEPGLEWDLDGDGDVDADDIKLLTGPQAVSLYHEHFWNKLPLLSTAPAPINHKWFDTSVNVGLKGAAKIFQRALNAVSGQHVADDGVIGPMTESIAHALFEQSRRAWGVLFAMKSEQAGYYRELIARRPTFEKYRLGWIRRAYDL